MSYLCICIMYVIHMHILGTYAVSIVTWCPAAAAAAIRSSSQPCFAQAAAARAAPAAENAAMALSQSF